ncbi:MAG: DUF2889 domain-containing protein [Gammaproteobacteria bacterium]|nr:DUF2889 domain-containing protein [Gammaproteobacteria bacterium]
MPLTTPVEREHLHSRDVKCQGFRRRDGLWDIEAHLIDTKTFTFPNRDRGGVIAAGEPLHGMSLRVTLDLDFVIHGIEAVTDYSPFTICVNASTAMKRLVGLKIAPNWLDEVRRRIGKTEGCTHLIELLRPMASTAYQTMHFAREEREDQKTVRSRPRIIDTCHALASNGPIVKLEWPDFYTGED